MSKKRAKGFMDDLRYFKALKSAEKSKVNQMRSPDLKFSTKNRIFDLGRLRAFESKHLRPSRSKIRIS